MRPSSGVIAAVVLVVALTTLVTWPQASLLSSHVIAHHDTMFSIWRLGWVAHALQTSPFHIFDANIFSPARHTLAYSDATLLEGLIGAPLFWLGLRPSLIYNLLLLMGYVGSGLAMFVLVRHLTKEAAPALVAAAIFTVAPYRTEHVMHLELQWAMFIPLVLWTLHRTFETGSMRWGIAAGAFAWLQLLACVYYGVFLGMVLVAFVPLLLMLGPVEPRRAALRSLAVGGALAVLLTVPFALPYVAAADEVGGRNPSEVAQYSATPINYLSSAIYNRVWGWTADRWGGAELRLFPGFIAIVLAVMALVSGARRILVLYAVLTLVALELSFGLNGTLSRLLFAHVEPLQGFRALARFAIFVQAGIAVLAAFGAQALASRIGRGRTRAVVFAAVLLAIAIESSNRPLGTMPAQPATPPDLYKVVQKLEPGVMLELPLPPLNRLPGNEPDFIVWSLWHFFPLVNGYSGYYPPGYLQTVLRLMTFPTPSSVGRLRGLNVRYLIVHRAFYDEERYTQLMLRLASSPEFKPLGSYQDSVGKADLFELTTRE